MDCGWWRDLDWGSVPQWLTFAIALPVGGFTVWGIITARRSYQKSVADTHVAQARLVYATLASTRGVSSGRLFPEGWMPSADNQQVGLDLIEFIDDPLRVKKKVETASTDLVCFLLDVHNTSKEVIGAVEVTLIDNRTEEEIGVRWAVGTVDPESMQQQLICVPLPDPNTFRGLYAQVTFRDSAGTWWRRIDSRPVDEIEPL